METPDNNDTSPLYIIYIMYVDASNNTPSYTHVVWRFHP